MRRFLLTPALALLALLGLSACSSSGAGGASSSSSSGSSSAATSASPSSSAGSTASSSLPSGSGSAATSSAAGGTTASSPSRTATGNAPGSSAQQVFDAMTEAERVGQLLMVDCPTRGVAAATVSAITTYHAGSVILDGTSQSGMRAIKQITGQLELDNPSAAKLFIATDQEGGLVQRLQGPGFSSIPSGVQQGQIAPRTLQSEATTWGQQLRAAGITIDLAPVMGTVPAGGGSNPPIGDLDREYGHTPATVTSHGLAVLRGLAAAGVDATVKHFPGLGRVSGNTDTTMGVTDSVTTRNDAYLAPFRAAVQAGTPFMMMSTAIYSRLDPGVPAAFSKTIVTDLLRRDLGFTGVIISDDLGAAKQVAGYSAGNRAIDFVQAGGDVVLTVDATQTQSMTSALLRKANSDSSFKALVDAAALRVLQAKQARGLLG